MKQDLSALGKVGSAIDNFKSSVKALNDDELFTGRDAKIDQKEGEEVIAITTDSTASNGSYAIDVNQLAKGSRVMSAPGVFPPLMMWSLTRTHGSFLKLAAMNFQ